MKYKVGDRITIKSWEQIKHEYPEYADSDKPDWAAACGMTVIITEIATKSGVRWPIHTHIEKLNDSITWGYDEVYSLEEKLRMLDEK